MSYYGTVTDGDTFFLTRLDHDVWDEASDDNKVRALNDASRAIDRLNFIGDKYDEDQELEFPRGDDTTVPTNIEHAAHLIAYDLLDGRDPQAEFEGLQQNASSWAPARSSYDRSAVPEHIAHKIPNSYAWDLLKPYLRDGRNITVS